MWRSAGDSFRWRWFASIGELARRYLQELAIYEILDTFVRHFRLSGPLALRQLDSGTRVASYWFRYWSLVGLFRNPLHPLGILNAA